MLFKENRRQIECYVIMLGSIHMHSCIETAISPHVSKIIVQSDNAKNLNGKQTKLLLLHVCLAAGVKLVWYTLLPSANTIKCIQFGEGKWWEEGVNTHHSAAILPIPGISGFYAAQYITTAEKQQIVRFYNCNVYMHYVCSATFILSLNFIASWCLGDIAILRYR